MVSFGYHLAQEFPNQTKHHIVMSIQTAVLPQSRNFSDEFETVICKQFTYWMAPTSDPHTGNLPPIKSFIESEFPEWKQAFEYDFETIDLVIARRGIVNNDFYSLPYTKQDLINDIEARNVAVAMLGHNILDLEFGLRQTASTSQGVVSTLHFPEAGGLSEPIVFQATDDIITSGFEDGQSVSVAKKLSTYSESYFWSNHYYTPLYDPTGDFETMAYTKRVNHPNFANAYNQPALVRHKNRPIITVPWGTFSYMVELTDDGRKVVRNCLDWLAHERTQSYGRRMLAEVGWNLESSERNVPTIAIFMLVLLVSVSLCVCVSCRRKKSAKESSDYKMEIICA